ncbi:MAG: hypothetical protein WAN36_12105 [Calditrichia bacterium]
MFYELVIAWLEGLAPGYTVVIPAGKAGGNIGFKNEPVNGNTLIADLRFGIADFLKKIVILSTSASFGPAQRDSAAQALSKAHNFPDNFLSS